MLSSLKHAEQTVTLDEIIKKAVFKGRLVINGCDEFDCTGADVIEQKRQELKAEGLTVRPANIAEIKCLWAVEAAIAAERGYTS